MNLPSVSIIVPVFNVSEYLGTCLDSILRQTYERFELLLVDDGSTDGSGDICDRYGEKDSRIRVFHKENGGVSSARNVGLDHAIGEWIYFVDSDDEVFPDGLKTLVDGVSDDVDIVLAGYERCHEDGSVFYRVEDRVVSLLDKQESLLTVFEGQDEYYITLGYVWIRLLRNKIIQEHHLRFDTEIRCMEDSLFLTRYICCSNGVSRYNTEPVYKYYHRENGTLEKWSREFNIGYADCLFALVKMKKEIEVSFPGHRQIVDVVRELIWGRYKRILDRMDRFGVQDEALTNRMQKVMRKELGFGFFARKAKRRIMRSLHGLA